MKETTTHRRSPRHRHGHNNHRRRRRHHLSRGTPNHRYPFATCHGGGANRMTLHSIPCKPHHKAQKDHEVAPSPEAVRSECQASAQCDASALASRAHAQHSHNKLQTCTS